MLPIQKTLKNGFYALISLPSTAMGLGLAIQISALSWLLSTKYHLDIHEIGLVWAAGPLAGIFGQVIVGLISDRIWFWGGRRRPFILIGGTLAALMLFLLPSIGSISDALNGVFGHRTLLVAAVCVALTLDLAINISFNPTRSLIADVTPEGAARTKAYTWMQTISGFWGVMAYVVGATLGNETLIQGGAIVVLLFSVLPVIFIEEPRSLSAETSSTSVTPAARTAQTATDWAQLWKIWIAHGLCWFGVQTMFVYIIAYIQQRLIPASASVEEGARLSGQIIAISFAVLNTVGFVLPGLVLHPLARRYGRVRTHWLAMAIMAVGYLAIALVVNSPLGLYAFMAVVGIGWGAVVSLPFAIMSDHVDRARMGLFMGLFNLSVVLPQLGTSLVGGPLGAAPDKSIIFVVCGASLALSAVFWMFVREQTPAEAKMAEVVAVPSGH